MSVALLSTTPIRTDECELEVNWAVHSAERGKRACAASSYLEFEFRSVELQEIEKSEDVICVEVRIQENPPRLRLGGAGLDSPETASCQQQQQDSCHSGRHGFPLRQHFRFLRPPEPGKYRALRLPWNEILLPAALSCHEGGGVVGRWWNEEEMNELFESCRRWWGRLGRWRRRRWWRQEWWLLRLTAAGDSAAKRQWQRCSSLLIPWLSYGKWNPGIHGQI